MSTLLVWKEQLQTLYTKYSNYATKILQFALGFCVFSLINSNVGFMKAAASTICTIGLAAVCTFLPLIVMVVAATALILLHFYTLSMPIAMIASVIFLIMYIFYFRFTPGKAWLVLLTPVAIALKVPFLIPIAFGLVGTSVFAIPAICGTIAYYMVHYVKSSSAALKGGDAKGMVEALLSFTKQALTNKEMWVMAGAIAISLMVVYAVRTRAADHAWKIASASGAVTAIIIGAAGNVMLDLRLSYAVLVGSAVAAVALGLVLEFLLFSVDYARTEHVQFEDDEYYYYVKAVPKTGVAAPKVSVKHINERLNQGSREEFPRADMRSAGSSRLDETAMLDSSELDEVDLVRRRAKRNSVPLGRNPVREADNVRTADEILLTQSLTRELGISFEDSDNK